VQPPAIPANEQQRLRALHRYDVLDTPPDPSFDALTTLAANIMDVPIALISLVDADRQWFKSRYGLDAPQTPRDVSFCGHVVAGEAPLFVSDAQKDVRFADNPLVTGAPRVRFYAGMPLRTPDGFVLGTLCAIDHEPKALTLRQQEALALLARQVIELLELQRRHVRSQHELRDFIDNATVPLHSVSEDGLILWANQAELDMLGYTRQEYVGRPVAQFHVDTAAADHILGQLSKLNTITNYEARLRAKDGSTKAVLIDSSVYTDHGEFVHTRCITRDITEQAVRIAELETHRKFFDLTLDLLCTANSALRFEYLNPAWQSVLGWTLAELRARPFLEFIHPEDLGRTQNEAGRLLRDSATTVNFDNRYQHKDGSWVNLSWVATVSDGVFFCAARDMTKYSAAAASQTASESRLRAIIDSALDAIITIDERGYIERVNPAVERIFGFTPAELLGHNVSSLMPSPDRERHDGYLAHHVRTGERKIIGIGREVVGRRKDGSEFPAELAVSELRVDGKRLFTGMIRDVSERKRASEALARKNQELENQTARLDAVIHTVVDGIITLDAQGIIHTFNPAAERIFGRSEAEVVGTNISALTSESPGRHRDDSVLRRYIPGVEQPSATANQEVDGIRKDGTRFPLELAMSEMTIAGRRMFTGVLRDITERKRIDVMKSEFISTVSHELRTPLTSIRGSLGLVSSGITGELPEQAKEYVDIALSNSERLVRLINDILDIEKIQSGRMELHVQLVDLASVIEKAMTENEAFVSSHGAVYAYTAMERRVEVVVDEDRLIQVLTNLISNAAKFSPPGKAVEISVVAHGTRVRINVRDHGPGISESFRSRIFQRFAQADSSDTRKKGGTGLGLSISKALVEGMKGELGFEAADGGGTRFFFELPWLAPVGELYRPSDATETRVLVCEDDLDAAHVIRRVLENEGSIVHVAPTLARARELLAAFQYKIITLDLMLADGSAGCLVSEIRQNSATCNVPIIVISGSSGGEIQADLGPAAMMVADILPKPTDETRLLNAIRSACAYSNGCTQRVLHVEDDADLRRIVKRLLPEAWDVVGAETVADARTWLLSSRFDLVLLDLTLPDGGGVSLLDLIGSAQVIIFSATEASPALAKRVTKALVKSRTTEFQLRDAVLALMSRSA
jgi:PAS domain S-box-containing protein